MDGSSDSFFVVDFTSPEELPETFGSSVYIALSDTRITSISCVREVHGLARPWAFSAFFAFDASAMLYFLSPVTTEHGASLQVRPEVALTVCDTQQTADAGRVGLQAVGDCWLAEGSSLDEGLKAYRDRFPATSSVLHSTETYVASGWESQLWVVALKTIKLFDECRFDQETWYTASVER